MKKVILVLIFLIVIIIIGGFEILKRKDFKHQEDNINKEVDKKMNEKIKVTINRISYEIKLEDNKTSQEFLKMLPLKLKMKDLNNNEKYYYFDNNLPSTPQNVAYIKTGDIMLYNDNCLVIFYEDFKTSYSYTRIGQIINPLNLKDNLKSGEVYFEKAD